MALKISFTCVWFLVAHQSLWSQTYKAGLLLFLNEEVEHCCIQLPDTQLFLYKSPHLQSEREMQRPYIYLGSEYPHSASIWKQGREEIVDDRHFFQIGYEVYALMYEGVQGDFVKVLGEYWVHTDELKKLGLKVVNWKDFLLKHNGKVMGYYANEPGLNLRKGPSTDFEKILTIKGDLHEISLIPQIKGLWSKAKVKVYKKHPCEMIEPGDEAILKEYEGWIKLLDGSGTPNIRYYPRGC